MSVELATAYISLTPSFSGLQQKLRQELGGPLAAEGLRAGDEASSSFGSRLIPGIGVAAVAAGAAFTAAMGAAAVQGLRAFGEFESGMNEVFTLLPNISEQAMGSLQQDVRGFATEMGVATSDVIPALYQSLSAGVPQNNVFDFLETAQQAAMGGVTSLETAVDGISSVVNAFGGDVIDAGQASDLMFTAVRLGKTTFEELSASLSNVNPIAAAMGVNFADVTAGLATMTAQGVPTAQATTQLRQLFVELGDAGTQAGRAFEEVAGQSLQDFMAAGGDTAEALDLMQQAADDAGIPIQQMFGSIEAGSAALALTGSNADTFASNLAEMGASAGATEAAYTQMDQGMGRAMERLKVGFQEVMLTVGENLAPALQSLAAWLQSNMPAIQEWVTTAMANISGFITDTAIPAFQWFRDAVSPLVDLLRDHATPILTGLAVVAGGALVVGIGSAAASVAAFVGPAVAMVAAVAAVVAGVVAAYQESEVFRDRVNEAFAAVQQWTAQVWPQIQSIISSAMDAIRAVINTAVTALTNLWKLFGDDLSRFAASTWQNLQTIIGGALNIIRGIFEVFAGVFTGDWTRAWDGVKQIFTGAWDVVTGYLDQALNILEGLLSVFAQVGQTIWSGFVEGISNAWDGLWSGITSGFGAVRSNLEGLFSGLVSSLGTIWDGVRNVLAAPINWVGENVINRLSGAVNQVSSALGAGSIAPVLPVPLIPTFHEGGVVGRDGRLTGGPLRPGERLIKAQDGEEVLTVDDPRHRDRQGLFLESDVAPIGGPFDWIGDVAASAANAAREVIANTARPIINALMGPIESMAGRFGVPGEMVAGAGRKLVDAALQWLSGAEDALPSATLQGTGWQALVNFMRDSGVPHVVTSTYRAGDPGAHGSGRAADFSIGGHGNRGYGSPGLRAIWDALVPAANAGQISQMILSGAPQNYRNYPSTWKTPGAPGNHWNHVHAATFDRGGTLKPGWNTVLNATGADEPLVPAGTAGELPDMDYWDAVGRRVARAAAREARQQNRVG